jgi:hypothetical protein
MPTARLETMLSGSPWRRRKYPFPHYVTTELFAPKWAERANEAIKELTATSEMTTFDDYDASALSFTPGMGGPLGAFISKEWIELFRRLTGVPLLPHVNGGIHHHGIGSDDGQPHCDYNPVFFADVEPIDGVVLSRHDLVDYTTGKRTKKAGKTKALKVVRGIAILYYAGNDDWQPGDGGETGLYMRLGDNVNKPVATVPPRNNTMLAFECTPYSMHSFISNTRIERNSVVMWLHRSIDDIRSRWGEDELEGFG